LKKDEVIKVNAKVKKKLYPKGNEHNNFFIYSISPNSSSQAIATLNEEYNNFIVSGKMQELIEGNTYDIEIIPSWSKKHGDGYSVVSVTSERPSSIKDQQEYVQRVITDKQYKALINKYPEHPLLDMFENDDIDYSDIKGIGKTAYQKIKDNLFNNMITNDLAAKLKNMGVTFTSAKALLNHFGSSDLVIQLSKDNIYRFCEIKGFGFKKVDEYAILRGDDPMSKGRILAATKYLLDQDEQKGHSWMFKQELLGQLHELLKIDVLKIETIVNSIQNKEYNLYVDDKRVASYPNYKYELAIKKKLIQMINTPCKTKGIDSDEVIKTLELKNGFEYTDEQKNAIRLATNNNILILNGRAGSGKTFTVKGILEALRDYSYHCSALSGKAAKVLSSNGLTASTIHRMLGINKETGGFAHNEKMQLQHDIVILDESSMANIYLIYSIVIALKDDAKIIFVGDNGQLPSIGVGSVFDDLLSTGVLPQQELTKIHRQAQKSGILSVANRIRTGNQINKPYEFETQVYGELKDMVLIPVRDKSYIQSVILSICEKYKHNDLFEFQVLTTMRERGDISVKTLNNLLQPIFNPNTKEGIKSGWYEYKEGDKIIQNGNNYEAKIEIDEFNEMLNDSFEQVEDVEEKESTVEVFNGTMGKIIKINKDKENQNLKVYIQFEDIDEVVVYERTDLMQIELAYAITTHKSQGSTLKHVLFALDYGAYKLLSREMVYTAITRASKGCVVVAENRAFHHAIENTTGDNRRTFLKELLNS